MKNHLKRIAAPRTWNFSRKGEKYTLRPNCGAHSLENGLALGLVLRDVLKLSSTIREAQKLLNNNKVIVDGKRKKDRKEIVGLFDVISIPSLKKHYQITLDQKGRLQVVEISEDDAKSKIAKVVGKTVLPKGKLQLNLQGGKNIISDKDVKVGDSVVLSLPDLKIVEILSLTEGAQVFLTRGRHAGSSGKLKSLERDSAKYEMNGKEIETTKKYLYVIKK